MLWIQSQGKENSNKYFVLFVCFLSFCPSPSRETFLLLQTCTAPSTRGPSLKQFFDTTIININVIINGNNLARRVIKTREAFAVYHSALIKVVQTIAFISQCLNQNIKHIVLKGWTFLRERRHFQMQKKKSYFSMSGIFCFIGNKIIITNWSFSW